MPEGDKMTTAHAAPPLAWPTIGTEPFLRAPFEIVVAMQRYWLVAASQLLQNQAAHLQNLPGGGSDVWISLPRDL